MATLSVGGTTVFDGSALQSGVTGDVSGVTIFPAGHIIQTKTAVWSGGHIHTSSQDKQSATSLQSTCGFKMLITPTNTSAKILIIFNSASYIYDGKEMEVYMHRNDSTQIGNPSTCGGVGHFRIHHEFLDEPNTTSQVSYEPYFFSSASSHSQYLHHASRTSAMTVMEIQV